MSTQAEVRIILMGKTGNGKSSTGNSLLRKDAFTHKNSPNAVTEQCEKKTGTNISNTVRYTIVDTPGLMDTSVSLSKRVLEIQRSVGICPEPHAFLIVFNGTNRMTEDERFTIDILRIVFGEKVFEHTIVVFTHGNEFKTDLDLKLFWKENKHYVELVKRCGNRVTKIENIADFDLYNENEDAERILKMIEELSGAQDSVYNYKQMETHKNVIMKHSESYQGKGNIHEEVSELVKKLGEELDTKIWKKVLYGGALLAIGATGGVGVSYLASSSVVNAAAATGLVSSVMSNAASIGGAFARTAGTAANAAAGSSVGAAVLNNGSAAGGAVLRTAWSVATKFRFR